MIIDKSFLDLKKVCHLAGRLASLILGQSWSLGGNAIAFSSCTIHIPSIFIERFSTSIIVDTYQWYGITKTGKKQKEKTPWETFSIHS